MLERHASLAHVHETHCAPRGAAALRRAAGVEDLELAAGLVLGEVAVAENDCRRLREARPQALKPPLYAAGVVSEADGSAGQLDSARCR